MIGSDDEDDDNDEEDEDEGSDDDGDAIDLILVRTLERVVLMVGFGVVATGTTSSFGCVSSGGPAYS